ncbi:MAG: carbonic anhydrase [Saprospiraceae bacterium]|nr:carbonic anhydrase [Saprospiraceae bacterium]
MNFEQIFENNKKWIAEKTTQNPAYFEELSKNQSPEILYIGCADSRVTAEDLMGAQPGELFVHRNVANMVVSIDMNVMSVINYAVAHLKVKHIIVCGHYECGGVKASLQQKDLGILNPWLRNIRDVYRTHQTELDAISDTQKKIRPIGRKNVEEQCINVIKTAVVQKAYKERGLSVQGWVFDIRTGKIIDLKIDFPKILSHIMKIYNLE